MSTHTVETCVIGIGIQAPFKNLLCVRGLLARNGISCGRAQFKKKLRVYFGLLKSNLFVVHRLAFFRINGCSGVID